MFNKSLGIIILCLTISSFSSAMAQEAPRSPIMIGAEVFIEPGQSADEIELWFKRLQENGMELCRIRLFEDYMKDSNGNWDFRLFDQAFSAAEKYGIKIFGSLFPYTPGNSIGGFKFPLDSQHEKKIKIYIEKTVRHFKNSPALYGWVLMNEPGTGGHLPRTDYSRNKLSEWKAQQSSNSYRSKGYRLLKNFEEQKFLLQHNTAYLAWIAKEVEQHDNSHHIHVNNHQIFENVAEYDFPAWRKFLHSLGASAHPSWHFGFFKRPQYTVAISANCNLIRSGAGQLPFLVTELQGGNNTYSGKNPFCPSYEETLQWLWTSIATGAKGIIFWCLNARSIGEEAGEWALLDFQHKASNRMQAASEVVNCLTKNNAVFSRAEALESNINILYNRESLWVEKEVQYGEGEDYEGRQPGGVIKSALAYYEMLCENGIVPNFKEFNEFDWSKNSYQGVSIILAHQIVLPSWQWENIRNFVKKGGKLFVEGLSGFYDENMLSLFNTGFPLEDVFGGSIREVVCLPGNFPLKLQEPLAAHLWKAYIQPKGAEILAKDAEGCIAAINQFGQGKCLWIPSLIGLGARRSGESKELSRLLLDYIEPQVPIRFRKYEKGLFMQTMQNGNSFLSVVINKSKKKCNLHIEAPGLKPKIIFPNRDRKIYGKKISIRPEETLVLEWN